MQTQSHDQEIKEVWALFRETSQQFKETDKQFKTMSKELDGRFKETDKQFKTMSKELDGRFKETDKQFKAMSKEINRLSKLFESQWGKLMESLAGGGILKVFQERGIMVNELYERARTKINGRHMEIDLLLVDGDVVVVVEVKTTLNAGHVKDFLKRLKDFPDFFTRYRECKIYGAVAALKMEQSSDAFAQNSGLYVLRIGGDGLISMLNPEDFKARQFS